MTFNNTYLHASYTHKGFINVIKAINRVRRGRSNKDNNIKISIKKNTREKPDLKKLFNNN